MKANRSTITIAEEILLKTGHPLHYKTLTSLLLDKYNLKGKTPALSVRSALARNTKFRRVAEGVYALSIWDEYPAIKFAKDIGYEILEIEGEPIDINSLGKRILDVRKFKDNPVGLVRALLRNDKRFYYLESTRMVGLTKWNK